MHTVSYHHTAMAIKIKVDTFCIIVLFAVALAAAGAIRRRLVAFMKALDLLHWPMHTVLHHRTAMAIKMASKRGTLDHCRFGPTFKLMPSHYIILIGVISLFVFCWPPPPPTMDTVLATIVAGGRPQF